MPSRKKFSETSPDPLRMMFWISPSDRGVVEPKGLQLLGKLEALGFDIAQDFLDLVDADTEEPITLAIRVVIQSQAKSLTLVVGTNI